METGLSFNKRIFLIITTLIFLLIIGIFIVPGYISPFSSSGMQNHILFEFRIPKSLTALFAGMSLAISGFILQQLFRNNLAGPYILGVSSGASLAVGLVIIAGNAIPLLNTGISISMAGFIGAFSILLLILAVSAKFGYGAIILLFGVIIGQLTGALQGLLSYIAIPTELKSFTLWSMGSFNQVIGGDLIILIITTIAGITWAFFLMPSLSVMLLGEDVSRTLGVNTGRISMQLLACTGLLTGIATAYCGPIAFIGMAIPNAVRMMFKTSDFRKLLLVNAALGSCMALLSDIISSLPIANINIPVNVTTSLIGGPFILYILFKNRN
jgi:iron complex transport system permease protein